MVGVNWGLIVERLSEPASQQKVLLISAVWNELRKLF